TALILLAPPLAAVQAYFFFHETLMPLQFIGFAMALAGVLLARSRTAGWSRPKRWAAPTRWGPFAAPHRSLIRTMCGLTVAPGARRSTPICLLDNPAQSM